MKFTPPHWAIVVITILATVAPQLAKAYPDVAWLVTICGLITQLAPIVLGALGVGSGSALASKQCPPGGGGGGGNVVSAAAAKIAPLAMLALAFVLSGCLSSAATVPVTPANQDQVTTCKNTATTHNDLVIGGFVLSGSTAGLAGVAAAEPESNGSAKTALGVAGAIVGGLAIVDAAVAEMSNSNFQNSHCSDVVGALPTAKAPTSGGQ